MRTSLKLGLLALLGFVFSTDAAQADHKCDRRGGEAIVYKDPGFRGSSMVIKGPVSNLVHARFNDTISSLELRGTWEICVHHGFRGRCEVISGSVYHLGDLGMNNNITSLRPVSRSRSREQCSDRSNYGRRDASITLFRHANMRGTALSISGPVRNLQKLGFNDTVSSIDLGYDGPWLLCEHADFLGRCSIVDGPVYNLRELGLNDRVSSLKPYRYSYSNRDRRHRRYN